MGEEKRKRDLKDERRRLRREARDYWKTVPSRLVKAVTAFLLIIPGLLILATYDSFKKNQWIWSRDL